MKQYLKAQYYLPVIAFVFISLYALFLISGGETRVRERRSSLNQGGGGYFLFYKLFKQLGYKLRRWYEAELPKKVGCLIYYDYYPGGLDQDTIDAIVKWVKQGNVLFLVGVHGDSDPVFYRRVEAGPARNVMISKKVTSEPHSFSFSFSNCFAAEAGDEVLLSSETGALLIRRSLGSGLVYLFADNNLFVNRYFINPFHAVFLNRLLNDYFSEDFYIYEYGTRISVYQVKNAVMILFKGDLVFVTLHLLLLGMIFAVWKGKRFGKPLRAEPFKRRSISVHLAAVGGFMQKTKANKIVESLTRKYLIYRAKQILNIKKNISIDELVEMLSKYSDKTPAKIKILLENPSGIPERMLLMKRKEIHDLITEIRDYKQKPTNTGKPG
ncbi:MAG: DUF4350 domain-containing protein [Candidatus Aminicenantes bacterium]|jgi:hypothetical protein